MAEIKPISGFNDRVELYKVLPLETPFTLNVFPTNACNFKCNYCAQSLGKKVLSEKYNMNSETMSIETMRNIVEQSKNFKQKYKLVSFMGHGEPLINRNLPEFIEMVNTVGIAERTEIITNASLLSKDLSNDLIQAGLTNIRISLQGLSSKKYEDVCEYNLDFEKFIENIAYFHSNKKSSNVFVKIVDIALDKGEEDKFYKIFDKISDRMYIEYIKPVYEGVKYLDSINEVSKDRYGNSHEARFVCPLAFYMLSVWPSGEVSPCDAIYNPVNLGNVNTGDIVEMWNSKKLNEFRIQLLNKEKNSILGCKSCCAPDDVSTSKDNLDEYSKMLKEKFLDK